MKKLSIKEFMAVICCTLMIFIFVFIVQYLAHRAFFFKRVENFGYNMSDVRYSFAIACIHFLICFIMVSFIVLSFLFLLICISAVALKEQTYKRLLTKRKCVTFFIICVLLIMLFPQKRLFNYKENGKYLNAYEVMAGQLMDLFEQPITADVENVHVSKKYFTSRGKSNHTGYYLYSIIYTYQGKEYSSNISYTTYSELNTEDITNVKKLAIYPHSKLVKGISNEQYHIVKRGKTEEKEYIQNNRIVDGITGEYPYVLSVNEDFKLTATINQNYHNGTIDDEFQLEDISLMIQSDDDSTMVGIKSLTDIKIPEKKGNYEVMLCFLNGKVMSNSVSCSANDNGIITKIDGKEVSYDEIEKPFKADSGYTVMKARFVINYSENKGNMVPHEYLVGYEAMKGSMYIRIWNIDAGITDLQGYENARIVARKFGILP